MDAVGKDDVQEYIPNENISDTIKSFSISIPVNSNELNSGVINRVAFASPSHTRNDNHQLEDSSNEYDGVQHGWAQKKIFLLKLFSFEVMSPHEKYLEPLNKIVLFSYMLAIFLDPFFFYLLSVKKDDKCVSINWKMAVTFGVFRSITDFIYLMRIFLEFKLAFISPESEAVGAGDLVFDPKKIAMNYLSKYLLPDIIIVLPVPQIIVLLVQPNGLNSSDTSSAKFFLQNGILIQYIPRLIRFLRLLVAGESPSGLVFASSWATFVTNLLAFLLASHFMGSCWYMLGLLRVNRCLEIACHDSPISADCTKFIDCGHGTNYTSFIEDPKWNVWKTNENASACFSEDNTFNYGIYKTAVNLTIEHGFFRRSLYSSFWGLQQISTLAGNQIPSFYEGEVLFTMAIIGLGLLLFAFLIGNMQNFLQGLGRRQLEKALKRRDVEQWMSHRRVPHEIRRKVRKSEHYNWVATRGVNEEMLMESLPEDLQRDIRYHLFKFVKQVHILKVLGESSLYAICERLRQETYIEGGTVLYKGGFVTKMIFIVRGKMESIGKDGKKLLLSECDTCGEELLKWSLEHSSIDGDTKNQRKEGNRLVSNRTVKCLTNVEAFVLRAADLAEVIDLFDGFVMNRQVQFAIRNQSPYWKEVAATSIQLAWRYKKKQLSLAKSSRGYTTRPSTSNLM